MSDMSESTQLPEGYSSWNEYWAKAHNQPWRTEPEISKERQRYLAERLAVKPNFEEGIYPFREEHGGIKLTRSDIEWLLTHHTSGGIQGPVDVYDPSHQWREGLDLRGTDLREVEMSDLPMARLRGGASSDEWFSGSVERRDMASVHMEDAFLSRIHLEQAILRGAHLEAADLGGAHLQGAKCREIHLEGTNLRQAIFDIATVLDHAIVSDLNKVGAWMADTRWNGVNLAAINWEELDILSDENQARDGLGRGFYVRDVVNGQLIRTTKATLQTSTSALAKVRQKDRATTKKESRARRLEAYQASVRAYRQLARALLAQGNSEDADRFNYRAQLCQRNALRRQHKFDRWLVSCLLDLISGYGYKPLRSLIAYIVIILGFAGLYLFNAQFAAPHLTWDEALVLSVSAFHGRGFFTSGISLGATLARLAAGEAIIGLLIEITFIATFTQRFFAR